MATVISSSLVPNRRVEGDNPNAPLLCFDSFVNAQNTSLQTGFDSVFLENLANPSTAFFAQIQTLDEFYIEIDADNQPCNYIGIARHNLSFSSEIKIVFVLLGNEFTVLDYSPVENAQVILKRFNTGTPDQIRVYFRGQVEFVNIGVLYAGTCLQLQRNIYVGHTPITMGRTNNRVGGFSDSGQFLGRVLRSRTYKTSVQMQNLTPDWYRENLDPWIGDPDGNPAFFSWRPSTYPDEIAYAWIVGNPQPSNQRSNGMMQISFDLEGLA
jgi:hypothetical protein